MKANLKKFTEYRRTYIDADKEMRKTLFKDFPFLDYNLAKDLATRLYNHIMGGSKSALLLAQMQMGKTAVIQTLALMLSIEGTKRRLIYCCSVNRVNLKDQVKGDFTNIYNSVVLDPKDFKSFQFKSGDVVIFDECHYGNGINQLFGKQIYQKIIDTASIFKIFISATPFDAIAASQTGIGIKLDAIIYPKKEALVKYHGLAQMLKAGRIVDELDLDTHIPTMQSREYGIIRAHGKAYTKLFKDMTKKFGKTHELIEFIQGSDIESFLIETLRKDATRPRIYFVKQSLRQGDRIDCTYLNFTYDTVPYNPKLDTIVQSLVGRACGFGKPNNAIHRTSVAMVREYVKMWEDGYKTGTIRLPEEIPLSKRTILKEKDSVFINANVTYVEAGYSGLPETIQSKLQKKEIAGKARNGTKQVAYIANNKSLDSGKKIATKQYFGKGTVSDYNIKALTQIIKRKSDTIPQFQQFLRNGNMVADAEEYETALFFVNTSELEHLGVAKDSCFMLTREGGINHSTENTSIIARGSFHEIN